MKLQVDPESMRARAVVEQQGVVTDTVVFVREEIIGDRQFEMR